MNRIEWQTSFSVENDLLDNQHRSLIELINRMHKHLNKGQEDDVLDVLHEMKVYTEEHFSTEEQLFQSHNFPQSERHIQEHQEFLREIEDKMERLSEENSLLIKELVYFLEKWLIEHILGSDQDYIHYLKQ